MGVITLVVLELGDAVEIWRGSLLDDWVKSVVDRIYTWGACSVGFSAVDERGVRRDGAFLLDGVVPQDPNWRLPGRGVLA